MAEVRIIVDHLKLDYSGPVDMKELFKLINAWLRERGFQKWERKNFEQNLPDGKYIEYEIAHWKKISEYVRFIYQIRLLASKLKRIDVIKDKKKLRLMQGRILIYIDGYIEHDYEHRWEELPIFHFIRMLFDKFIYKAYTERFEQRITYDLHDLYNTIETFLNTYRYYAPVTKIPHFAH